MPLQLRGTFPVEGKANENPVEHSTRPITNDRRTFREAETRLGVEKLCVSLRGLQGHFGRVSLKEKAIRYKGFHSRTMTVRSQICKQICSKPASFHLSGKHSGVMYGGRETTELLPCKTWPLDPIKSRP